MYADIDNVVFDLGGVVIDLHRERAVEELKRLGIARAGELLDRYVQRGPFLDLETGRITAGAFYDKIRSEIVAAGAPAPADLAIQNAFNAFLVRLPEERLDALRALRKRGKRVFALSNTNPVMYNSWIREAFAVQGLAIDDYFEGVVASFREGCCKPGREIFEILLRRYGLDPQRTLYLDDSPANCEAAAKTGMQTVRVGQSRDDDMLAIISKIQ